MSFFHGFQDELEKLALDKREILPGLAFLGLLGLGQTAIWAGMEGGMRGLESIHPRLASTAQGAGSGLAAQALLNAIRGKGQITRGPAAVGALGGALWPEIKKSWSEL